MDGNAFSSIGDLIGLMLVVILTLVAIILYMIFRPEWSIRTWIEVVIGTVLLISICVRSMTK